MTQTNSRINPPMLAKLIEEGAVCEPSADDVRNSLSKLFHHHFPKADLTGWIAKSEDAGDHNYSFKSAAVWLESEANDARIGAIFTKNPGDESSVTAAVAISIGDAIAHFPVFVFRYKIDPSSGRRIDDGVDIFVPLEHGDMRQKVAAIVYMKLPLFWKWLAEQNRSG